LFQDAITATETFQLIKLTYGDNAIFRTWDFEWYARENLEDDERSGQPTAVRTPDIIETVCELIQTDCRMTLRMMEVELEISRETICKILMEDLRKQKTCARFVPHCLTNEQKALRLTASLSRVYSICG
jgi:hypothetical protein